VQIETVFLHAAKFQRIKVSFIAYRYASLVDSGHFSVSSKPQRITLRDAGVVRYFWRAAIVDASSPSSAGFELMAKSASKKHEDTTGPVLLRSVATSSVDLPHLCTFSKLLR